MQAVTEGSLREIAGRGFLGRLSSPDLIEELTHGAPSVYYPKGSISFPARDGAVAALVVSGLLRYYMAGQDGRQLTIRYLVPADLVGTFVTEPSYVDTRVQALRHSVLLILDVERLRRLAGQRPELSHALIEELTSRLRSAFRALGATAFTPVRSRVARDIIERAAAFGLPLERLHLAVTQQALADATGSVREVVARSLRELRSEGVIATDNHGITVLDAGALARAAGL